MKTNYTKAPWAWQKFGDKYCLTAQHGMREIILSANIDEEKSLQPYLSMNNDGILKPVNPDSPNAKLLAAAPDMLETLQMITDDIDSGEPASRGFLEHIKILAESVIKKATE